jgi:hypothetical protein
MTITADSYDFSDIQNEITDLVKPLASLPDYSTLNADKDHYINRGYIDFVRRTGGIEDRIDITTVAEQTSYSTTDAANLKYVFRVMQVRWDEDTTAYASSDWEGLLLKPYPGGYGSLPKVRSYGSPYWYWTRKNMNKGGLIIGTWPIVGTANQTIRVFCTRFPTSLLANATDEPDIMVAWQPAIIHYAVWKLYNVYSHRNPNWERKAIEHRDYYFEYIQSAQGDFALDSYDDDLHVVEAENSGDYD